jgi:hypothetical protein
LLWAAVFTGNLTPLAIEITVNSQQAEHAEHSEWLADGTGSAAPFDPSFLDIPIANGALADKFWARKFWGKSPADCRAQTIFCGHSPAGSGRPITNFMTAQPDGIGKVCAEEVVFKSISMS